MSSLLKTRNQHGTSSYLTRPLASNPAVPRLSMDTILRTVLRRAHAALSAIEHRWQYLLALLALLSLAVTVVLDGRRPLWNDELFTLYISHQPNLQGVWNALLTGAEQLPIFFFVIVRLFTRMFGNGPIPLRLPETIGFVVMNLCTFAFVRKRVPASYGFVAFLFPAVTDAYYFAYEARPYGLVMGFCGLATVSWQSAAEGLKRPWSLIGTGIFLACAFNCHYYAVLLLFPFALGELARFFEKKRLDWAMYMAVLLPLLTLVPAFPLIRASSKYSSHFWARPSWTSLISFYSNLLFPAALALTLLVLASGLAVYLSDHRRSELIWNARPTAHEFAIAFGFVLLPIVAICLAKFVTGAFTSRYAIYSIIGLSILLSWSLAWLGRFDRVLGLVLAAIALGCWLVAGIRAYEQFGWNEASQNSTFNFLASAGSDLPVVMASPHQFFVQSRLAADQHRGHFIYLADVPLALKYTETDTVERGLLALKNYAPLDVEDYRTFAAAHSQFLVYGFPDPFGWVIQDLLQSGRSISIKGRNGDSLLYLVGAPGRSGTSARPKP